MYIVYIRIYIKVKTRILYLFRVRSYEGTGLTIRIPRQLSDKGLPSAAGKSSDRMSPSEGSISSNNTSGANSKAVSKSKSLTTSMDKLNSSLLRPNSRNSSSRESSTSGGSRGSTPLSSRVSSAVISKPPSRISVQNDTFYSRSTERSSTTLEGKIVLWHLCSSFFCKKCFLAIHLAYCIA